jgi:hypothetical protein
MRLVVQTEHDEPGFFRAVRVGQWLHWFDYITRTGTWTWRPVNRYSNANASGRESTDLERETPADDPARTTDTERRCAS